MKPHAKFEYFWTSGMHLNQVTKFGGNLERIQIGPAPPPGARYRLHQC
jgi:hypothetical protein